MLLLDTHVVAWIAMDRLKLSKRAQAAIDDSRRQGGGLAIAGISLFELAHLVQRKRIEVDVSVEAFLQEVESRFVVIPMDAVIAARSVHFPAAYPNDPIDRIIGATALIQGLPLVTADRRIRESKVLKTIW
ncbi:MAG: type II toxin-antitoxin system VapC family toxin [Terriglobales bacterium]|jgi:PIN domain nuclease of toxin-antitoxin system